jgi:hypothetical protein
VAETIYEGEEGDANDKRAEGLEPTRRRVLAPSTLLPNVLHQLGLTLESYPAEVSSEIVVDDVITNLKNDDWRLRIAAVRKLEKLGERVPVELLESALDDEDSSVRAAAVRVLGCAGRRAPLPRLVAALHDADWHVRETAIYVLGKRWQDIPLAELEHALHDVDGSVRQAARLALHIDSDDINSVAYGRLWEQKSMQHKQEPLSQHEEGYDTFKTEVNQYAGEAEQPGYAFVLHEQTQTYDPSGPSSYEHASPRSEHWEKVTNLPPRSRSQKGWWGIVAATAVVFFLLGSGATSMMMPVGKSLYPFQSAQRMEIPKIEVAKQEKGVGDFSQYSNIIQKEVSAALGMTPDAIRGRLRGGQHLSDIATAQGISEEKLQQIEFQALTDATNAMFAQNGAQPMTGPMQQASDPNGPQLGVLPANGQPTLDQLKGNPKFMDALVTNAFLMNK